MSVEQADLTVRSFPPANRRTKAAVGLWLVPLLLIFLSAIPIAAGVYLLIELAAGHVRPEMLRHLVSPTPVVLHVVGAATYTVMGAFQFIAPLRLRFKGWHGATGRLLILCGLAAALSGMWITLFYERLPDASDLLFVIRLVFSSAMVACLVLGFISIRQRAILRHRAWMMRAYAIGLGAGTQAMILMVVELTIGRPDQVGKALLMGAAWAINLAVAEWVIRRRNLSISRKVLEGEHAQCFDHPRQVRG